MNTWLLHTNWQVNKSFIYRIIQEISRKVESDIIKNKKKVLEA